MTDYLHRSERALARAELAHLEPPDDAEPSDVCAHPGRYGCGRCDACDAWADHEAAALEDRADDPPAGWDF